jgi:small subunit ribosomal protein S5
VRPVVEAAGIKDLLTKVYGSNNPVNVVKAAYQALGELVSLSEMARRRDMAPQELAQRRALREASNQETSS